MNYVLKYSLLKLFINHRCHKIPKWTEVISALPWSCSSHLSFREHVSNSTAHSQVPLSGCLEAFSFKCPGLKCACKCLLSFTFWMFIALAGYLVFCMQPSVVMWEETGCSILSWNFALGVKSFCAKGLSKKREWKTLFMVLCEDPLWGKRKFSLRNSGKKNFF